MCCTFTGKYDMGYVPNGGSLYIDRCLDWSCRRNADRNSFVPQSMERDKRIEGGNNGFEIVILKNENTPSTLETRIDRDFRWVEGVLVFYRTVCYGRDILI